MKEIRSNPTPQIITIGFDGPHRVGKETQMQRLQDYFASVEIPSVIVRGDGSREGRGECAGDPVSVWWQNHTHELHRSADLNLWNKSSYRLARELLVWKKRTFPRLLREQNKPTGVILIDRSLISRTIVPQKQHYPTTPEVLYANDYREENAVTQRKKGHIIHLSDVVPTVLFHLSAPEEVLLSRLDSFDPKYAFRRRNIQEGTSLYNSARQFLPDEVRKRVISVDASRSEDEVSQSIIDTVRPLLDEFYLRLEKSPPVLF